jgi:hypothetical protein
LLIFPVLGHQADDPSKYPNQYPNLSDSRGKPNRKVLYISKFGSDFSMFIQIPSGNLTYSYCKWHNVAIEIVDFPMKNGDFFHSYVSLPEGIGFQAPKVQVPSR